MQKKKLINFRPTLCLAVSMIVSIILATNVFISQRSRIIFICIFGTFTAAVLVYFLIVKKKFALVISASLLFMVIPFVSIYSRTNLINQNKSLNVNNCYISGKIYKVNRNTEENKIYIYLDDVRLKTTEDTQEFNGDFFLCLSLNSVETERLVSGQYIKVKCEPKLLSLEGKNDRKDLSFISRDVVGTGYAYSYNLKIENKVSRGFRDNIKNAVYELLSKTDMFYSGTGYAMLFGDSTILDNSVSGVFYKTGIAHLLAVSGFHISIIVAFISFVLNKLKTNKHLKLAVISLILIVYAYICNFSPSVIRASIMSIVALFAANRNKEYDGLSALSLACCIILLINPLDLFNMSFVLSFVSVLSIILLMPLFKRLLSKIFYNKLASMLALSFSTSIGVSTFQLYYIGSIPVLSFFANLITVPVVSVLFIYLIVAIIFGSIFGIAVPLINIFVFGMKYVLQFNSFIASANWVISVKNVSEIVLLLSLATVFIMSDYVFIKKKPKWIISGAMVCLIVCLMIF